MSTQDPEGPVDRRRRALLRLGLATVALYAAPAVTQFGGRARASSFSASFRPRRRAPRPRASISTPPPEIVIGTTATGDIQRIADQGFRLLARDALAITGVELARFALPAGVDIEQARQQIADQFPTALFDVNHVYTPEEFTCDADGCLAFEAIGWQHVQSTCVSDTSIGMVDTSINIDHAALRDVPIETISVVADDRAPASALHGTAIAILIGGGRDTRTPGLLNGASIVAAQAFHRDQAGRDLADAFDIARAIDRLVERGLGLINLSFAGPNNAVLKSVVEAAIARDVLLVAAAGNSGPAAQPLFPAAYDGVVAVTAVDYRNRVYRQANAGDHVDFAAPGVRLWTAASISGGRFRSGTSYAAPFVTAALGLARARWPEATSQELVEMLSSRAVDLGEAGRDPTFGWGLIQADELCTASAEAAFPGGG